MILFDAKSLRLAASIGLVFTLALLPACAGDDDVNGDEPIGETGVDYLYSDLTFDEAQEVTPFKLVMPREIPSEFEFEGVSIKELAVVPPGTGQELTAVFSFSSGDDDETLFVLEELPRDVSLEG